MTATATGVTKPPGYEEALRASIAQVGVIHPIVVGEGTAVIIDGRRRKAIADELKKVCPEVQRRNASQVAEERLLRRRSERDLTVRTEIIRLGLRTDNEGVGLYTEDAIAAAMGVSLDYALTLLQGMALHDTVVMPELRRTPEGTVKSRVTNPAPGPERHPVAEIIPPVTAEEFAALKADIAVNGQKVPIVLDQDGLLVDGKARWKACAELGIIPVTQIMDGNAWVTGLENNVGRFPDQLHRARILAQVPIRTSRTIPDERRPPPIPELSELFKLPTAWFRSFRQVYEKSPEMGEAILDETVRVGTAVRIVREIPRGQWPAVLERMRAQRELGLEPSLPMRVEDLPPEENLSRPRRRRDVITASTIDQVRSNLAALGEVLTGADGQLDPSISSDQAAQLLTGLTTDRRHLTRLYTLLKQRKEST